MGRHRSMCGSASPVPSSRERTSSQGNHCLDPQSYFTSEKSKNVSDYARAVRNAMIIAIAAKPWSIQPSLNSHTECIH
ncbi:hypothetical protein, partial [Pseudomonas sp. P5_A2_2]